MLGKFFRNYRSKIVQLCQRSRRALSFWSSGSIMFSGETGAPPEVVEDTGELDLLATN